MCKVVMADGRCVRARTGAGEVWRSARGACLVVMLGVAGSAGVGCSPPPSPPPDGQRATTGAVKASKVVEGVDARAVLQPRIMARGAADAVPSQLIVSSLRRTLEGHYWRALTPHSALLDVSISPEAPGKWSSDGDQVLRFEPSGDGLEPGTTYTVSLRRMPWRGEGVSFEAPITASFTTPGFAMISASEATRRVVGQGGAQVSVSLTFSAPVNPWEVARRATITLDGQPLAGMPSFDTHADDASLDARRVVTLTWQDPRVEPARALTLTLAEGVPFGAHRAPAARVERTITAPSALKIKAVALEHVGGAQRLRIACEDGTPACTLDPASAAQHITISPAVATTPEVSGGALWLKGAFARGEYTVVLAPGLRSASGVVLAARGEYAVQASGRAPALRIAQQGTHTTRHAWNQLALHHVNVGQVEVTISHIPMAQAHLGWDDAHRARMARVVAKGHLTLGGQEDEAKLTLLPLRKLMAQPEPGLYHITATSGALESALRVVVSELHLVMRRGINPRTRQPELMAWVVGAHDLMPRVGVAVEALRANGTSAGSCTSDMAGACTIAFDDTPAGALDDSPVRFMTATHGPDATLLALDGMEQSRDPQLWWDHHSLDDVEALRRQGAPQARFRMFPARYAVQPGELVPFIVVGRDPALRPAANTPVAVHDVDAEGRTTRTVRATTDALGVATVELTAPEAEQRWGWCPTLHVAGREQDPHACVTVEVPWAEAGLEIHAHSLDRALVQSGQPARFELAAMSPLRIPAQGVEAEGTCTAHTLERGPLKGWPGYTFDPSPELSQPTKGLSLGAARATYDADADPYYSGRAVMRCATSALPVGAGYDWRVQLEARQEVGNRIEALDHASVRVAAETYRIGLKAPDAPLAKDQAVEIEGVVLEEVALTHPERALSAEDARFVPAQAVKTVEITTTQPIEQFALLVDDAEGRAQWRVTRRQDAASPTISAPVDARGRFRVRITPRDAARDLFVRARAGRAVADVKLHGAGRQRYDWAARGAQQRPEDPQRRTTVSGMAQAPATTAAPSTIELTPRWKDPVTLTASPAKAKPGEPVEIAFRAPFRGRALWTVETDHVVSWAWQDVRPGAQTWRFTPKREDLGPLRVALAIFKDPHLESPDTYLPSVARGMVRVPITPEHLEQPVTLDAPKTLTAGAEATITLTLQPPYEPGTRALVQVEEIHSVDATAGEWPDILPWFTREADHMVLGAQTLDTPLSVLARHLRAERPGGGITLAQQLNAFYSHPPRWTRPVTPLEFDARGRATLTFKAPARAAKLRVNALVLGPDRVGRAQAVITATHPLLLLATAPRVLTAGDTAEVPVVVQSAARADAHEVMLDASVEGAHVSLVDAHTKKLTLDPRVWAKRHALGVVRVKVAPDAPPEGATATLTITARSGAHTTKVTRTIRIRPAQPPAHMVRVIESTDATIDLTAHLQGWDAAKTSAEVWLTPTTEAAALAHVNALLRRPHGTLNEITLATLPLLALLEVWPMIEPVVDWDQAQARAMVQDAVWRALGMQRASGGLASARERDDIEPVESARAVWMLWQAQRAGFEVPRARLDAALVWMQDTVVRMEQPNDEARMHWWLARMGRGQKGRALQLLKAIASTPSDEEAYRKLLLLAALHVMGDQRGEAQLRAWALDPEKAADTMQMWGSSRRALYAELMQLALVVLGRAPQGLRAYDVLVRRVTEALIERSPERWDADARADALVSLAMWLRGSTVEPARGALTVGQGDDLRAVGEGEEAGRWRLDRLPARAVLRVDRASAGRVAVVVTLRGERTGEQPASGLRLERQRVDASGKAITDRPVRLGEQVFVRLRVSNTLDRPVHQLALAMRLPAGLFLERVAWSDVGLPRALRGEHHVGEWRRGDRLGMRDAVSFHGALGPGEVTELTLVTRAITAGTFTAPALLLHDAYNPEALVALGADTVRVEAPWSAPR